MVQVLTRERLAVAKPSRRDLAHWGSQDPLASAELVRRDVIGTGACLPLVWFCDGLVVPVVTWHHEELHQRRDAGLGPVLYRSMLADRLVHGRDHLEPAVLAMEAFITVWPLASARGALAAVSGYASAVAAVPAPPGAESWEVFECDYYGFTVAEVDPAGARVLIEGLGRPRHPAGGVPHQRRLMEEQLFDVALRTDTVPTA